VGVKPVVGLLACVSAYLDPVVGHRVIVAVVNQKSGQTLAESTHESA
jgi:hypothetical protein